MGKQYLVTGGTGFLGAALVRRMLGAGHRVRVLDNNSRGRPRRLEDVASSVDMVTADIRDAEAVRRAVARVDSVVHMAYVNGTKFFYEFPELVLDVGIRGTLNVLDACRAHGVREFVLASTSETYQVPPVVPTPENVPLVVPDVMNRRYSYGGGKIAADLLTINWAKNGFDRVMIFRPHNVYGADMGWEHVVPQFIVRMIELQREHPTGRIPFPVLGDGKQSRAFVHIDDFTDALMQLLGHGQHMNVYHLSNPETTYHRRCRATRGSAPRPRDRARSRTRPCRRDTGALPGHREDSQPRLRTEDTTSRRVYAPSYRATERTSKGAMRLRSGDTPDVISRDAT
jgi:dTDP-glucose 4,6-dehydratase/UDP-glucose 4-epimerase